MSMGNAFVSEQYDQLWRGLDDFIKYNPGACHRRRLILKMLKNVKFQNYLDVGCGSGDLMMALHRERSGQKIHYTGVDLSSYVVKKNATELPEMSFQQLNIEQNALESVAKFDLITCSEVLEHLDHRDRAMKNLASMLAPGGTLLVSCPTGKVFQTEKHFGHTTHPTAREFRELAKQCDLEVQEIWNWGWPCYRVLKEVTNVNPEWSLKNFANHDYNWSQKGVSKLLYLFNFLNINSPFGCQLFVRMVRKVPG